MQCVFADCVESHVYVQCMFEYCVECMCVFEVCVCILGGLRICMCIVCLHLMWIGQISVQCMLVY